MNGGLLKEDKFLKKDWHARARGFWFELRGVTFRFSQIMIGDGRFPAHLEYKFVMDADTWRWESTRSLNVKSPDAPGPPS